MRFHNFEFRTHRAARLVVVTDDPRSGDSGRRLIAYGLRDDTHSDSITIREYWDPEWWIGERARDLLSKGSGLSFHHRARGKPIRLLVALQILLFGATVGLARPVCAQSVSVERVASGLARPVFLTAPPGDFDRVFIVEQHTGQIRILDLASGVVRPTPFLTIGGLRTGGEQGLLGLAFHPAYASNGFFFVNLTDPDTRIQRYRVSVGDLNVANPASQTPILDILQPQRNHNGGWIGFGPDGYLYISTGDGGSSNDAGSGHTLETGNAQDLTSLLGKILRIDVDADDFPGDANRNYAIPASNPFVDIAGNDEIWAYGLRNAWRPSFDRLTGDLYIADVGQATCEEINLQLKGSTGGENYGWRLREGVLPTPTGGVGGARPAGAIDPFLDYSHGGANACSDPPPAFSGFSITGGYVYRGPVASLQGRYFFADFFRGQFWSTIWDGSSPSTHDGTNYIDLIDHGLDPTFDPDVGAIDSIASFGEDADANLYVLDLDGEVFRVPEPNAAAQTATALGIALIVVCMKRRERFASSLPRPAIFPPSCIRSSSRLQLTGKTSQM